MRHKHSHSRKKPVLRIGNLYIGKTGLLITFFSMLTLIIVLMVAVVFLARIAIYYTSGDLAVSQDSTSKGSSYTLVSVTPSNCTLLSYSKTIFKVQLNYSAYSSFDKLSIYLSDLSADVPSAHANVSVTGSSAPTIRVSKSSDEDFITIRIYGKGPFFSNTGSSVLLLTAVYSME